MPERLFIVGVQRCGTTYLYHLLNDHPEVVMATPVRPEPKVFLDDSIAGDPRAYDERVFPQTPAEAVRGEKSTSYLDHEPALARMASTFPQAKVLVILRDPVERALSHYQFSLESGVERRDVTEAILDDIDGRQPDYDPRISVSPFEYVRRGRYVEQLRRLERHVDRAHTCVVILEELISNGSVMADIYRFLGVDSRYRPRRHESSRNASQSATDLPVDIRNLLRTYFAPWITKLEHHLGRDLEEWQRP
jgi:hypothetical protein